MVEVVENDCSKFLPDSALNSVEGNMNRIELVEPIKKLHDAPKKIKK